mmetsp:Transcript_27928/g.70729  ORF Transcript_27928/g.70729 Transcript_27928/m.70729 type:complete len:120 (-) Transcript_27928:242-601(-)
MAAAGMVAPLLLTRPAPGPGPRAVASASMVAASAVVLAAGYLVQSSAGIGGAVPALGLGDAILWGKHDRRTKRGKRYLGTFGKIRPRKPKATPWSAEQNGGLLQWAPEGSSKPPRTANP